MASTLNGWRAQTNAKRSRECNQKNVGRTILDRPGWLREMVVLMIPFVRKQRCYVAFHCFVLFTFSGQTACVTMYYNVVRRVGLGGLTVLLLRSELLMLKHKMFCNSKINPHGRTRKGGVGKHNRAPKGQRKLVECDSRLNGTGILSVLSLRLYVGFLTCVALCCAFSVFPN